jgi:hypothetical protein
VCFFFPKRQLFYFKNLHNPGGATPFFVPFRGKQTSLEKKNMFGSTGKLNPVGYHSKRCCRKAAEKDHDFLDKNGRLKAGRYTFGDFTAFVNEHDDDDFDVTVVISEKALIRDFGSDAVVDIDVSRIEDGNVWTWTFTVSSDQGDGKVINYSFQYSPLDDDYEQYPSNAAVFVSDYDDSFSDGLIIFYHDDRSSAETTKAFVRLLTALGPLDLFTPEEDLEKKKRIDSRRRLKKKEA